MPFKKSTGEYKTWKEFFKEWKQGIEKVTPLQQSIMSLWGITISTIGIIWGIIFSFTIGYKWMAVILVGGLIVAGVQFLGMYQRKVLLKRMEDSFNKAGEEVEENAQ